MVVGSILFLLFLPDILKKSSAAKPAEIDTKLIAEIKKLELKDSNRSHEIPEQDDENTYAYQYDRKKSNYESNTTKFELFYFDPNTISTSDWKRLGIRDKTIQTIHNYIARGGRFYKPDDLQKIYGLHQEEYERLFPYVKIESKTPNNNEQFTSRPEEDQQTKTYTAKYPVIDINSADTSAFISLPGIGSKLAARIINFREKLGGFYSVDQIGETYGLPDSTFQKIKQYLKLDNPSIKKIKLNSATIEELKAHPYIKFNIANPIVSYRNEHGPFSKIEDIKNVMAITDDIYKKIAPYLTL